MKVESRKVQIGPASIYYQRAGSGDPLVLVHGLSGSGRWWSRNVGYLAHRYNVHIIDLIGFGRSRGRHRFVLDEASYYLGKWMEHLGIERAGILGHSMGGVIAIDLAATCPERVDRLVLIDAAMLAFERTNLQNAVGLAKTVLRLPFSFVPVLFFDALRAGPFTIAGAARALLTTDARAWLDRISVPVLIVWGERDGVVPLVIGQKLADAISGARLAVIDGAGHNPMWDRPGAFNEVVGEFLGQSFERTQEAGDMACLAQDRA